MTHPAIFSSVTEAEADRLALLARDAAVLEVGSWTGFSAIVMAREAEIVHAVDWHQGDDHAGRQDTLPGMWANLARYHVRHKVVIHVGRSERVLPFFAPGSIDFAFLDAFHSEEDTLRDALLVIPLIAPRGVIAFHDYGDERFGVTAAVDGLWKTSKTLEWMDLVGTLAVLRVP